uniref:Exonuclease domain-containing protein n=1 Tax=Meloidogyne hapla TaxID=6305 RepID=A0A1I8BYP1_MELHA
MINERVEYLFEFFESMSDIELQREMEIIDEDSSELKRSKIIATLRDHYRDALIELRKKYSTRKFYNYFIVIDFECSCEENNYDFEHEIIEFPAVMISVESCNIQEDVDKAPTFPIALQLFRGWMAKHGLDGRRNMGKARRFCYITDGPWDIGKFFQMECFRSNQSIPHDFRCFMNIRRSFVNFYTMQSQPPRYHCDGNSVHVVEGTTTKEKLFPNGISLNIMLKHLNIQFTGREHCGMDDTLNIAFIVIKLLEEGAELRQKLVFNEKTKAPSCVASTSSSIENDDKKEKNPKNILKMPNEEDKSNGNEKIFVWKKWWDEMPYKLVRITRYEFLGDRHLECESCDEGDN